MEHTRENYQRKAAPLALVRRILRSQQSRLYGRYAEAFPPRPGERVLDLGVTGSVRDRSGYFFESCYPYPANLTAAGIEASEGFESCFPGIPFVRLSRDGRMPFADGEFDVVFCNAVIEHVGSRARQREFLAEVLRIGRASFVTTPNRWYPVELHTVLPLLHYLPTPAYRAVYRRLGFEFFASEEHLNLLTETELRALAPVSSEFEVLRHRFLGLTSNLLFVSPRREAAKADGERRPSA
jgi:hypothetical protein